MERSEFKRLDRREKQSEARSFAKDLEPGEGFAGPATPFLLQAQFRLLWMVTWAQQLAGRQMRNNHINTQKPLQ